MNELAINLKNIERNVIQKKAALKNGCRFCAVVKANAYGIGAVRVAHTIKRHVDYFAVARVEELEKLREAEIETPILVMSHLFDEEIEKAIVLGGEIEVGTFENLKLVSSLATKLKKIAFVHIAFDTGMHRFGFEPKEAEKIADIARKSKNVCVKGVMSHLFEAESKKSTQGQKKLFESVLPFFPGAIAHLSNSLGSNFEELQFDMVRVGIDLFLGKHPSVALQTNVLQIHFVKKNEYCGYAGQFLADKDMWVATIGMGYADGIPREAASNVFVIAGTKACRVLAVCMDSSIIEIESKNDVQEGMEVAVFGKNGRNFVNVLDFARGCGKIPYDVLTGIGQRVKRKYVYR